ncbi:RNA-binding protein 27 isoform X2 [Protopterus annectens]|uniref:RNA-binding protein 27 isoform X2 n=1 Tax=Protopterus annectens TaxID=7888 RepID=UPI001CFBCBF6|nr:RNA-binding protein 27 isoform X2 [Protopterus annectens]
MLIEDVAALKAWLAVLLKPICDADPVALSNYVVALVKKDRPEKELKDFCVDQLDVFLQKETPAFVDTLFEGLKSRSYLRPPEVVKQETNHIKEEDGSKEANLQAVNEEEHDARKKKHCSPPRNHSNSNEIRQREKRENIKRREYDRHLRNDSHRDRYNWHRGRSRSQSQSRSRSRSRSASRSRSHSKDRTKDEDQNLNKAEHRWSRFESEVNKSKQSYAAVSVPSSNASQQYSCPGQTIPNMVTSESSLDHRAYTSANWSGYCTSQHQTNSFSRPPTLKERCRDYDEKGFCVLGDLCVYDHGTDRLVVDEKALPKIIPFPPPPPGVSLPGLLLPPMTGPPPNLVMPLPPPQPPPPNVFSLPGPPVSQTNMMNLEPPRANTVHSLAPVGVGQPFPQHLQYTVSESTCEPDGYNPESPGITAVGRPLNRTFFTRSQTQRSNLIGLTSGDMDAPQRVTSVEVQMEPAAPVATISNISRVGTETDKRKNLNSTTGLASEKPCLENSHLQPGVPFQVNRSCPKRTVVYTNTKLEVRKIPPQLNNITQLNTHFCKFGTIVNIQVAFEGDHEGALIQYTTNEEARRAISSTEPVLNNRFIKVLWHKEEHHPNIPQKVAAPQVPLSSVLTTSPKMFTNQSGLTKTVYGYNSLKTTHKIVTKAKVALEARKKKQETLKLQQDMRKKRQEMLEKQIECQKMLISRLEKNKSMKPDERAEIMKTLKELTEKISHLKDELKPLSSSSSDLKLKSQNEAQKELLDAELDLHKKMTSGEDTAVLQKRLNQLQVEATQLGIFPGVQRKTLQSPCRTREREHTERGRSRITHMVVDHRPKKLVVSGFVEHEKAELLLHIGKFGKVEDVQVEYCPLRALMTFTTRHEAETVANFGTRFKGRNLQLSWYNHKVPTVTAEPEDEQSHEEHLPSEKGQEVMQNEISLQNSKDEQGMVDSLMTDASDLFLHDDDDDDEDDEYEPRSWRR